MQAVKMNEDIKFSLLNFSTPGEIKPIRTKPPSSQFAKLSSSKKKKTSATKENIDTDNKPPSNKNVSKNLLPSYDDSKIKSPQGILKERNHVFDDAIQNKKPEPRFSDDSSLKKTVQAAEDVIRTNGPKCFSNQDIDHHTKSRTVTSERIIKVQSKKDEELLRVEIHDENLIGLKTYRDNDSESNSFEIQGLSSQKNLENLKKVNSLSTSFSSLESSESLVRRSANRMAPRKLTESIISISSSPEEDKSFYESLDSFFPVKNVKSKKLISSTPRCSDVFFSPTYCSGEFESGVSAISKENALVSKCDLNGSLKKGRAKISLSNSSDKYDKILTDMTNKENQTNYSNNKLSMLKNLHTDNVDISKDSTDDKFDKLLGSTVESTTKKNNFDVFDALLCSPGKTTSNLTSENKLDASLTSLKISSRVRGSEVEFNIKLNSSKRNFKDPTSENRFDALLSSSKERNLSSEDKFDALLKSNVSSENSNSATNSKNLSKDNSSLRFKNSDESRIMFDTLKFRGVTIRRHRRQKVLGLQKDFMYDETSCSSEEEVNENYNSNRQPTSNNVSDVNRKSNNTSSSAVRLRKSIQFGESSSSSSNASKSLESKKGHKISTQDADLCSSSLSSSRTTRSKQSSENSKTNVSSSSGNSAKQRNSSKNGKSNLLSRERSQVPNDSLSPIDSNMKSKRLLGSSKSSLENLSSVENGRDSGTRRSARNKSTSKEVSESDSLLDAEKLLDELYGTAWHEKKDIILPRSSVKKKPPKEKPPKEKPKSVACQTLNFSDDSESERDRRKTKCRNRRDSFINDDSSSSENCDLNFYRTLSNKVATNNTKLKLTMPSSSSEDLLSSGRKKVSSASSSESLELLNTSLKNKNGGILKKGKLKKSPSFVTRKTTVLTSVLSDNKFKKPPIKKLTKSTPRKTDAYDSSDSEPELVGPEKGPTPKDRIKGTTPKNNTRPIKNTPLRPDLKKFKITPSKTPKGEHARLSFLASLSAAVQEVQAHPDALPYKKSYKTKKEELARRLLILFNREIFDSQLPDDMLIQWNARMRSTSGYCYNKKVRRTGIEMARVSRIVLSTKILDTPERLRDTLLHELCHSAAWVINGAADGHGPLWKAWANKAMRRFPEVPPIKRCHDYSIKTKFTYRCTSCGYSIGRHSKSLDTARKRCGYCYGAFELLVNHSKSNRKSAENLKAPRTPGKFALFVKENYGEVKKQNLQKTHAEIMKLLGQQFSIVKNQLEKKP